MFRARRDETSRLESTYMGRESTTCSREWNITSELAWNMSTHGGTACRNVGWKDAGWFRAVSSSKTVMASITGTARYLCTLPLQLRLREKGN